MKTRYTYILRALLFATIVLVAIISADAQKKFSSFSGQPKDEYDKIYDFTEAVKKVKYSRAVVVIHKGKTMATGTFLRHYHGVETTIIENLIEQSDKNDDRAVKRLTMVAGSEQDDMFTELWIVAPGEKAPTVVSIDLKALAEKKITRTTLFDKDPCCETSDDDGEPGVDDYILANGLDYLTEALKANPGSRGLIEISQSLLDSERTRRGPGSWFKADSRLTGYDKLPRSRFTIKATAKKEIALTIIPAKK